MQAITIQPGHLLFLQAKTSITIVRALSAADKQAWLDCFAAPTQPSQPSLTPPTETETETALPELPPGWSMLRARAQARTHARMHECV